MSQQYLDARRRQILDAAWRCFGRNGFHHTSMQDIFTESGLSAGAVYRYFSSKTELINSIGDFALTPVTSQFEEMLAEEPPPPMGQVVDRVIEHLVGDDAHDDANRLMVQLWSEALREEDLAEHFRSVYTTLRGYFVNAARRATRDDPDAAPEDVGKAAFSFIPGLILQRALLGDPAVGDYRTGVAGLLRATTPHD